jgi:secreted trypsin-like serine protease
MIQRTKVQATKSQLSTVKGKIFQVFPRFNKLQFSECGKANTKRGRIVGGDIVPPHKYPWMAAMFKGTYMSFNCGGSVITNNHVITAGERSMNNSCFS